MMDVMEKQTASDRDNEVIDDIPLLKVPSQADSSSLDRCSSENSLDSIIVRATNVIGDRDEAMRWLGTPVRGLGYATPISLLGTKEGADRVDDILGQIEHGIW